MSLKVTTIQSELHWENVDENLNMFSKKIETISESTDVIVLPEMFNTGFSMLSEKLAEKMNGKTVDWMKRQAGKSDAVITGSLIIAENNNFYNRLIWAQPDGEIFTYDKRHLFRMANEHENFSAGAERLIVHYKGWRICPMVCYDLRFPVWSRNTSGSELPVYDVLIYMANWPEARKTHWCKLLEARAIENQCYVVGVNRIGEDGNGFSYTGNTAVINFMGEVIRPTEEKSESTMTTDLSLTDLNAWREKFPLSKDGDMFEIS
jgi:omega-amidase